MSTQMFKAKDMKSAINLVNQEFGDDAIILSTKKNNGVVDIDSHGYKFCSRFVRALFFPTFNLNFLIL